MLLVVCKVGKLVGFGFRQLEMGGFIEQVGLLFIMCLLRWLLFVVPSIRKSVASYFRNIL